MKAEASKLNIDLRGPLRDRVERFSEKHGNSPESVVRGAIAWYFGPNGPAGEPFAVISGGKDESFPDGS